MNRPEQALQISVANFLRAALPPDWRWIHVPNGMQAGGRKAMLHAIRSRAMGEAKGFPDGIVLGPWREALFIELKAPKGRVSPEQAAVHTWLTRCGFVVEVCRSLEDVERFLLENQIPLRARIGEQRRAA